MDGLLGRLSGRRTKVLIWTLVLGLSFQSLLVSSSQDSASANTVSCDNTITNAFGGGTGTSLDPYLICNRSQLERVSTSLSSNFLLSADIDLAGSDWVPLGPVFSGVFDGGHYQLSNGVIRGNPNNGGSHPAALSSNAASDQGTDLYGLFAMVSGTVKNLDLDNFQVTSQTDADINVEDSSGSPTFSYQGRFPLSGVVVGGALDGSVFSEIRVTRSQVSGKNSSAGIIAGACHEICQMDLIDARDSANVVETTAVLGGNTSLGGIVGGSTSGLGSILVSRAIYGGRVGDKDFDPTLFGETRTYTAGILGYTSSSARLDQVMGTGVIQGSKGPGDLVGGLVTRVEDAASPTVIRNSIFSGNLDVYGTDAVSSIGGIADLAPSPVANVLMLGNMPTLRWSGTATDSTNIGPIVGRDAFSGVGGTVSQSFYNRDTLSAFDDNAELGDGRTTFELQTLSTYEFDGSTWSIAPAGDSSITLPTWTLDDYTPSTQTMAAGSKVWKLADNSYPALVWLDYWPRTVSAATSVTATSSSAGVANLSWNASSGLVTGYKIESSTNNGSTWVTQIANTGSSQTTASISGLTAGATYLFRISAIATGAFDSPVSTSSNSLLMGSNPGSPQNLAITYLSLTSARVTWDAPSNNSGVSIDSYTLEVDKGNGYQAVAHEGNSAVIDGIGLNSLWSFRVLATNVVGNSPYAVLTNTPPTPYSGPTITNLSMLEIKENTATELTIQGSRLDQVSSASVDGKSVKIISKTATSMVIELPALTNGIKNLVLVSSLGNLTHQDAFNVVSASTLIAETTERKLNAGSFKGYVALYAKGYRGQRLTAKVGNDWVIIPSLKSDFERIVEFTGAGYEINVRMFIDRVLAETKLVLTK